MSLNTKLLKESLLLWYDQDPKRKDIVKIIVCGEPSEEIGPNPPSLRTIEYCVINYAKKNGVCYCVGNKPFNMYSSYKSVSSHTPDGKDNFDFFRRGERFEFGDIPDGTTTAQLNFFRWAIENNVIQYVRDNAQVIEADMKATLAKRRKEKTAPLPQRPKKKRKKELNPHNPYVCFVYPKNVATKTIVYDTAVAAKSFKSDDSVWSFSSDHKPVAHN
jgi:hypothetical protein